MISDRNNNSPADDDKENLMHQNFLFQQELQDLLTLLVKENSLPAITDEIILRSVAVSRSNYGVIILPEKDNSYSFLFNDPAAVLTNKTEIERELISSFTYIKKWLDLHQRSLIITDDPTVIGYSLIKIFKCSSLLVTPCFFNKELTAVIILAKLEGSFDKKGISNIEQFALLLAFGISSFKTRELNTALENRLQQSQKLETIGKLTSGIAHDFSNLLSSIFGSLNLLKKRIPPREDILRLLDNIENCSVRAKDLTTGLLSFGKPTPKRKELIKPNRLLSEISKVITQTFPSKITFNSDIEDSLHDILGNGTEIYQVLLNLCVNAKEAIEGEGTISLSGKNIAVDDTDKIQFPFLEKGNYVCFIVKDTGSGIPEEIITRIFDPYFSTKEKETGSGLGLYVTYGIIKAHSGHIEVSSKPGEGTCFTVFIPSYEPTSPKSAAGKIILLADDEVMLRDLLCELLESSGYNVVIVSNGTEALKVLTEEIKVDLAVIDYNMPGMNGLELIEELRLRGIDTPVILSSGSLHEETDYDYPKYGINAVLPKPYEFDSMLMTIQKLI